MGVPLGSSRGFERIFQEYTEMPVSTGNVDDSRVTAWKFPEQFNSNSASTFDSSAALFPLWALARGKLETLKFAACSPPQRRHRRRNRTPSPLLLALRFLHVRFPRTSCLYLACHRVCRAFPRTNPASYSR